MKPYKFLLFVPLIISFASLNSCGSDDSVPDENSNDTYLDYRVDYQSDANQTSVSALVRTNSPLGNEIELGQEESITFEGDFLMYDSEILGYTKTYDGRISSGNFIFSDSDGVIYTNMLNQTSSIELPSSFLSFSKSEDLTITWDGSSLQEFEFVEVFIGIPEEGVLVTAMVELSGSESVTFDKEVLSTLPAGTWPVCIKRITHQDFIYDNGVSGRIISKYTALTRQVEVTD